MFTGIIEEIGTITEIQKGEKSSTVWIQANKILQDTKIGDSICTNCICLTVAQITNNHFKADVMAETYRRTNFIQLKIGSKVNLERALMLHSRLGGHMVSGHIDGTGIIINMEKEDNATLITIDTIPSIHKYIVEKGSIAIDGISLTIVKTTDIGFVVSIIPQTGKETTLLTKKVGNHVNLETDLIGKYVERLLAYQHPIKENSENNISEEFLRINGFM